MVDVAENDHPSSSRLLHVTRRDIIERMLTLNLSLRQAELVYELLQGKTDVEIAVSLGLSHQTVKNEMSRILKIADARNRLSLALIALDVRVEENDTDSHFLKP